MKQKAGRRDSPRTKHEVGSLTAQVVVNIIHIVAQTHIAGRSDRWRHAGCCGWRIAGLLPPCPMQQTTKRGPREPVTSGSLNPSKETPSLHGVAVSLFTLRPAPLITALLAPLPATAADAP